MKKNKEILKILIVLLILQIGLICAGVVTLTQQSIIVKAKTNGGQNHSIAEQSSQGQSKDNQIYNEESQGSNHGAQIETLALQVEDNKLLKNLENLREKYIDIQDNIEFNGKIKFTGQKGQIKQFSLPIQIESLLDNDIEFRIQQASLIQNYDNLLDVDTNKLMPKEASISDALKNALYIRHDKQWLSSKENGNDLEYLKHWRVMFPYDSREPKSEQFSGRLKYLLLQQKLYQLEYTPFELNGRVDFRELLNLSDKDKYLEPDTIVKTFGKPDQVYHINTVDKIYPEYELMYDFGENILAFTIKVDAENNKESVYKFEIRTPEYHKYMQEKYGGTWLKLEDSIKIIEHQIK